MFERLVYNKMFEYFTENDLISHNQSGFKLGALCINQLLSVGHEIHNLLMRAVKLEVYFLSYWKPLTAFGTKVSFINLKKENGISGKLLNTVTDFLYQWKQKVVLNGQYSSWAAIEAGAPEGSILGPLFFLIYTNHLSDDLASNAKLFADDTYLFSVVENIIKSANELNNDLPKISTWAF